jgi:hypothetical protein
MISVIASSFLLVDTCLLTQYGCHDGNKRGENGWRREGDSDKEKHRERERERESISQSRNNNDASLSFRLLFSLRTLIPWHAKHWANVELFRSLVRSMGQTCTSTPMLFFIYHEYWDWMSFDIRTKKNNNDELVTMKPISRSFVSFFFVPHRRRRWWWRKKNAPQ